MRLFICEKIELADAIAAALAEFSPSGKVEKSNGGLKVDDDFLISLGGHALTLCDPHDYNPAHEKWNMDDLPIFNIPWKYKAIKGKESKVAALGRLIKEADEIVNAGDSDPEGQLLVDELLEHFNNKKPVQRLWVNDNNIEIMKKALTEMKDNKEYYNDYQAALARSVADMLYGYNMTRLYTLAAGLKGYQGVLNIGRVKTPILGLVYNRNKQFFSHEKSFYYTLSAEINDSDREYAFKYVPNDNDPIDTKNRIIDKSFLEQLEKDIKNKPVTFLKKEIKEVKTAPPMPYALLPLQTHAYKLFKYPIARTKEITQDLRDKFDCITYNRVDTSYLNPEHHPDAPELFKTVGNNCPEYKEQIEKADFSIMGKVWDGSKTTAHHGIIPEDIKVDISKMSKEELTIYKLIIDRYLLQFFPDLVTENCSVSATINNYTFAATGNRVLVQGWKSQTNDKEEAENVRNDKLYLLKNEAKGTLINTSISEKQTKPLPLYNEGTLLSDLTRVSKYVKDEKIKKLLLDKDKDSPKENGGIGTPATRDSLIDTIFNDEYAEKEIKTSNILLTEKGTFICETLRPVCVQPDMTALWHEQQKEILAGNLDIKEFLNGVATFINNETIKIKEMGLDIKVDSYPCNLCSSPMVKKKGKQGVFWACTAYPECKNTKQDDKGKPLENIECPVCKKEMTLRKGKDSSFWGCTGYPECKKTLPYGNTKKKAKRKTKK